MKGKLFLMSAFATFAFSCANANPPANFNLKVNLTPDDDGLMVYLVDYDSGEKIDSAIVEESVAAFSRTVTTPTYARIIMEGARMGDIFIEPANLTVSPKERNIQSTGALYGKMQQLSGTLQAIAAEFRALPQDSTADSRREQIYSRYNAVIDSTMTANIDNPLGYMLFLEQMQSIQNVAELDKALAQHPAFKNSKRINKWRDQLRIKDETAVGRKYKDFEITNDGKTQRLSDYVGPDHYTLVDFWASWCGPCIRETKVIKNLYNKYNGKGLEVLGVAVWDEPQNTLKAIETHELPWKQILNAQTIPTDIYGISGIPCIILIAPDGTIVSRDKQDAELIADVEKYMELFASERKQATETTTQEKK